MKYVFLFSLIIFTTKIVAQDTTIKNAQTQETPIAYTLKTAWLEKWDNSKNYLIAIAQAMPDSLYDYKPTPRQMTFKEQLLHIKGNMDWLTTTYFTNKTFNRNETIPPDNKALTIKQLETAFDAAYAIIDSYPATHFPEMVDFFAGPKSKIQILNLLQDHVTHHRGQLIVYLNINHIEPPKFVGW